MQRIEYQISPARPRAHQFRVVCSVAEPSGEGQRFTLPAWIPGSYVLRDFSRQILSISAESSGVPVAMEKLDNQSWLCAPCEGPLRVSCEIYARDDSVRSAYLDHRRGFFNATSLCLRPEGLEDVACSMHIGPPPAEVEGDWQLVTTLPAEHVDERGFGQYSAENYAHLIDHPVAMGQVDLVEFNVAGTPHGIALLGRHDADRDRLAADLSRACEQHVQMFGELPVPGYLFLAQIVGEGYGGLEHSDCSMLQVARNSLPANNNAEKPRSSDYVNMLGLCSHEYFHLWNVKRIRPRAVAQSNLVDEAYFRDLWAYEGVTAYYDELALVRAGLVSEADYCKTLARSWTRLERNPGRKRQSLEDSSFDAWTKFYRPDENTPNAVVSYYGKGSLVALSLDLALRLQTENRVNLDGIMRMVWQRFGRARTPLPEGSLEQVCMEVAGGELDGFFDQYLRTTADPPVPELLAQFGIRCDRVAAKEESESAAVCHALGVRLAAGGEPRISHVLDNGVAQAAGLSPGDVLVALNGLRITAANIGARVNRLPVHGSATLDYFRSDELLTTQLKVPGRAPEAWRFVCDDQAGPAAKQRRQAWLGSLT